MSWADWLLLGLVAGWFLFVLLWPRKKSCCGSCNGCSRCDRCGSCGKEKKVAPRFPKR